MLKDADRDDSNQQKQPEPEKISLPQQPREPFWGEVIYAYTRAEAIADGVLIDVTKMANEAGLILPTAVTSALWEDINTIPEGSGQDVKGRLWDVLVMANHSIRSAIVAGKNDSPEFLYNLIMTMPHDRDGDLYTVKFHIGGGDDGKPVITLMKPNED
jgi:hypothetical protein